LVGLAALQWLLCGYGCELTAQHVVDALSHTVEAARTTAARPTRCAEIQLLVDQYPKGRAHHRIASPKALRGDEVSACWIAKDRCAR